jgi:8-oxo-dGTP diphosphatase
MPLLLVRHGRAGDRALWDGDDRERPLDPRGTEQANALVALLASFPVDAILSSPYLRCVQTVEPLAAARELEIELRAELGEELQLTAGIELVRAHAGQDAVICGHGGLERAVAGVPRFKKGATLVLGPQLELLQTLRP